MELWEKVAALVEKEIISKNEEIFHNVCFNLNKENSAVAFLKTLIIIMTAFLRKLILTWTLWSSPEESQRITRKE